jgi:hypothetical protein
LGDKRKVTTSKVSITPPGKLKPKKIRTVIKGIYVVPTPEEAFQEMSSLCV